MDLSLFDLHCDTACEMLAKHESLSHNQLAISMESTAKFKQYIQVMAFWTDHRLTDEEGWERMIAMRKNLLADPAVASGAAKVSRTCPPRGTGVTLLLGIEDARIFAGKPERVAEAYRLGVRVLTPLWAGETCVGGSHDTDSGLTAFGKKAVSNAVALGMIPDISHASVRSADEIFAIAAQANVPVIASHSNAKAVCPVSRNLSDGQIDRMIACGGLIGLNLYRRFLRADGDASLSDLLRHIAYFLDRGAADVLCFGGDWDGADLPPEIRRIGDLEAVAELLLRQNYPESLVRKLFFENAYAFAARHLAPGKGSFIPTPPKEKLP